MVDPYNITKYNRTTTELQWFILFAIVVAGKSADMQLAKLKSLLSGLRPSEMPFDFLRRSNIEELLRQNKVGQYKRLTKCLHELLELNLDLNTVTSYRLVEIHGIGFKTAKFFVTHSQKEASEAILDTHILKYLSEKYGKAPKSTPTSAIQYRKWEEIFKTECANEGRDLAEFDLYLWKKYKKQSKNKSKAA